MVDRVRQLNWGLVLVLLLGLGLRLWGIGSGLPYLKVADESWYLTIALRMFITGDPNPHWLLYPTFWLYLNSLAYIPFFLLEKLAGVVTIPSDIPYPVVESVAVGLSQLPAQVLLGRGLTAIFSAATVGAVYVTAYELSHHRASALIAALFFAVSPTSVSNSQSLRPEAYATFFVVLSFWWSYKALAEPRSRNYVLAGIFAGLAASCKYNAGFILVSILAVHWLGFGLAGLRRKEIYLGIATSLIAFGLTTPFAVLDLSSLMDNLKTSASVYSTGYRTVPGAALVWYLQYLWQSEGVLVLLAIVQVGILAVRRSKPNWALIAFPLLYFIFAGMFAVRNERTILLIVPFLGILAAQLTVNITRWIAAQIRPSAPVTYSALAFLILAQTLPPLGTIFQNNIRMTLIDGRDLARVWIETNLPPRSRIALEAYAPFIDPERFDVEGVGAIPERPLDWYENNGFEYLVFSSGMYGRFLTNSAQSKWVARYDQFFLYLDQVKRFNENGFEVRVYKTAAKLPSQRISARFGDQGDVIELIGYDLETSSWTINDPLTLSLGWRTLASKDTPLEVNLRLLDKDDREVGSVHDDLFQGQGWREGMISTQWTIPIRENAAPGTYRVEVNIIESQYNYQAPAQNWMGSRLDRVTLGPIKMSDRAPTTDKLESLDKINVRFGDAIALLGFSLTDVSLATKSLRFTSYWQALEKPSRDYTIFVHLLDANERVVAQIDTQPRGGTYPTSLWDAGEIVAEETIIPVSTNLPPGSYHIAIGLYEYPILERLVIADAMGNVLGDHLDLPLAIK